MKEKKTNMLQVLARRALLVVLDGAIVAFSFYFALLLRADGAVEASWWPHNRALLYANLPWIVALYLLSFLAGGLMGWLKEGIWLREGRFTLWRQKGVYLHCICVFHPDVCLRTFQSPWATRYQRMTLTLALPGQVRLKVRSIPVRDAAPCLNALEQET